MDEVVDFWTLPPRTLVDAELLSELLGVSVVVVGEMADKGELPKPISFAGRIMWNVGGICDHTAERLRLANEQPNASNDGIYVEFWKTAKKLLGKAIFDEIENLAFASMNVEREE